MFGECTQSSQPNDQDTFHMEVCAGLKIWYQQLFFQPNEDLDEITINTDGTYKIEFMSLMSSTNKKLFRTEIFKVGIEYKNPALRPVEFSSS